MKKFLTLLIAFLISFNCFSQALYQDVKSQIEGTAGASTQVLDYNFNRKYLLIQNKDATNSLLVKFKTVHTASEGIKIAPGGYYEPVIVPRDKVFIKAAAGSPGYTAIEGVSK